jgi:hypothetical protein
MFYFCITIQSALQSASSTKSNVHVVAYADDPYSVGPAHEVEVAFQVLAEQCQPLGLEF